jgi:hypothetical protein
MAEVKKAKRPKPKTKKPKKEKSAFSKLSDKHKLFVMNYVRRMGVACKAYMDTYPSAQYDTARTKGPLLVAKDGIKKAIDEKYAEVYAGILTEVEKTKTYMLIHAISEAEISDVVDLEDGTLKVKDLEEIPPEALHAIQAIEQEEKVTGQGGHSKNLKVKLHPKLQALKMRAEIQKLIDPKAETQPIEIVVVPATRPGEDKDE